MVIMKTKFLSMSTEVFLICLAFVSPIRGLLVGVGLFIVADTFIGIWKAKKIKQEITSRKLSQIVSKMVLYQSSIILFFVIEKFILVDFVKVFSEIEFMVTKIIAIFLCFIEIKSIDESIKIVTGQSVWDRFKEMLSRAKEAKEEIADVIEKKET